MNRFINYLKATRSELEYVSWPSKRQAIVITALVVTISLAAGVFLGFFDFVFSDLVVESFFL